MLVGVEDVKQVEGGIVLWEVGGEVFGGRGGGDDDRGMGVGLWVVSEWLVLLKLVGK